MQKYLTANVRGLKMTPKNAFNFRHFEASFTRARDDFQPGLVDLMGLDYFFCLHEPGLVKTPVFIFNPGQLAPTRVGIQLKLLQFCTHILFFTDYFCLRPFGHSPYFIA